MIDWQRFLSMNWDQFASLSRSALKIVGAYLIARGMDPAVWDTMSGSLLTILGGVATVGGLVASHYQHG